MSAAGSALLIVDDNEDNRYTLTRRLQREGYTNLTAAVDDAQALELLGTLGRKAEPHVDRSKEPCFDPLVGVADHRLERRDHVADHIFRGVVQQGRQPPARLEPGLDMGDDLLDHHRMLGH